jgi:hypothetical protein
MNWIGLVLVTWLVIIILLVLFWCGLKSLDKVKSPMVDEEVVSNDDV